MSWDPLPQTAPLLPAERPEEAPPREVAVKPDAKSKAEPSEEVEKEEAEPTPESKPAAKQPATKKRRYKPALLMISCGGEACRLLRCRSAGAALQRHL